MDFISKAWPFSNSRLCRKFAFASINGHKVARHREKTIGKCRADSVHPLLGTQAYRGPASAFQRENDDDQPVFRHWREELESRPEATRWWPLEHLRRARQLPDQGQAQVQPAKLVKPVALRGNDGREREGYGGSAPSSRRRSCRFRSQSTPGGGRQTCGRSAGTDAAAGRGASTPWRILVRILVEGADVRRQ